MPVFTTRPDTLFGATFFVLAPEHPLVERIANEEVQAYAKQTAARRGEDRAAQEVKTGVFTGLHAINPVNGDRLPVYVADYVLMEYGTGAIMAVPAHDERDREFAEAFGLPIVEVVTEEGVLVYFGRVRRPSRRRGQGRDRRLPAEAGEGRADCLVSPPRLELFAAALLGLPIPIVYCDDCGIVPVPEDELPVLLPEVEDYRPKGVAPLASNTEWLHVPCPKCGSRARARRTRWTRSSTPPGTSCATSTRTRTSRRSTVPPPTSGARSRSTSAASTTRPATSCTRGSS